MENLKSVILLLMGLPYENRGFHSFIEFTAAGDHQHRFHVIIKVDVSYGVLC